jgi:CBS domain containing-hemolysin-like protein
MVVGLPIAVLVAVLLAASACTSAMEAAMLAVNKVRLRHLAEQGHRRARVTLSSLARLEHIIGTLLFLNNLLNVALASLGSWLFVSLFGPEQGLVLATAVITVVVLIVCEITPKMLAATHAELVAFTFIWPLRLLMVLFHPIVALFTGIGRALLRTLRIPVKRRSPLVTEEEIKVMIQMGREAGVLAEQELRFLQRIFEFSDSVVREAMIPRAQITGIELGTRLEDVLDVLIEQGHSRIPVYRGSLDDVVGVIYVRDLLAVLRHGGLLALPDLIRPVAFVPPTKRLAELLSEFQRDKTQIAIVRDAAGKTLGLVTIEDLLEEIVGEIHEDVPLRRST